MNSVSPCIIRHSSSESPTAERQINHLEQLISTTHFHAVCGGRVLSYPLGSQGLDLSRGECSSCSGRRRRGCRCWTQGDWQSLDSTSRRSVQMSASLPGMCLMADRHSWRGEKKRLIAASSLSLSLAGLRALSDPGIVVVTVHPVASLAVAILRHVSPHRVRKQAYVWSAHTHTHTHTHANVVDMQRIMSVSVLYLTQRGIRILAPSYDSEIRVCRRRSACNRMVGCRIACGARGGRLGRVVVRRDNTACASSTRGRYTPADPISLHWE